MPRIRIDFSKTGLASFISHQDLPELFSRAARRAGLCAEWTQGFSPHPRLVLGPPLPMGVEGYHEIADFWFENWGTESLAVWDKKMIEGITLLRGNPVEGVALAKLCTAAHYKIAARSKEKQVLIASRLKEALSEGGVLLHSALGDDSVDLIVSDIEKASVGSFVRILKESQLIEGWHELYSRRVGVGRWDTCTNSLMNPFEEERIHE